MQTLRSFTLDENVVAKRIYRNYAHQTTCVGAVINRQVRSELALFLEAFLRFINCNESVFLRLDAFLKDGILYVIEINVELQDGWGVALNLLRASGNKLWLINDTSLPTEIILYNEDYLPEFELAQRELAMIGHTLNIVGWREREAVPSKSRFDDKLYLTQFSQIWQGSLVRVPLMFSVENTRWEDLPDDVVFKFREKYGETSRKARYSVVQRSQIGKGKFMRKCYNEGTSVAQEYIEPQRLNDGSGTQAIIMCSGATPITGYLQVAPQGIFIINDKTACKGVLVLE